MAHRLQEREDNYRVLDSFYRVNRGLFEVEDQLIRANRLRVRLAQISNIGSMSVLLASILVAVPILVSMFDLSFGAAPAIFLYCLAAFVVCVCIAQVVIACRTENQLIDLKSATAHIDLRQRLDFVLEEVASSVNRHRIIEGIIAELDKAVLETEDEPAKNELKAKRMRWEEIQDDCSKGVESWIEKSSNLVTEDLRTSEEHDTIVDWASAIPAVAEKYKKAT